MHVTKSVIKNCLSPTQNISPIPFLAILNALLENPQTVSCSQSCFDLDESSGIEQKKNFVLQIHLSVAMHPLWNQSTFLGNNKWIDHNGV